MIEIPIYLGYPNAANHPMMQDWLDEIREIVETDAAWQGWRIKEYRYNSYSALQINDVASAIKANNGPCILFRPVQHRVIEELRRRLHGRSVVLVGVANDPVDIFSLMESGRDMHLNGDPMLPRKFVIALLLLAKLEKHQMWGGKNKGYMWASELAKGRGLDEQFADGVSDVIHDLGRQDFLIRKVSNGKPKYGINPEARNEIYEALRSRAFPEEIQARLITDESLVSARELDLLNDQDYSFER